jgi:hypothetical protein
MLKVKTTGMLRVTPTGNSKAKGFPSALMTGLVLHYLTHWRTRWQMHWQMHWQAHSVRTPP